MTAPSSDTPVAAREAPLWLACFPPPIPQNPYQQLLYGHLAPFGVRLVPGAPLRIRWLVQNRNLVAVLHFHWQQAYYRYDRGPRALRWGLSSLRLVLLTVRLALARALKYRIVWTVHQVVPHELDSRLLDLAAAKAIARLSHALIVHDVSTADDVLRKLGSGARAKTNIVPHGPYGDFYLQLRSRDEVRAELEIAPAQTLFLSFGEIREYKNLDVLLEAFRELDVPDVALLVAGAPRGETARRLADAAEADGRIKLRLEFIPEEQVAELFAAADAVVLPRGDGGTSGALVLALSFSRPVIVAARPAYEELVGGAGWLFAADDPASLRAALRIAALDQTSRAAKTLVASERLASLRWSDIAAQTFGILRGETGSATP